MLKWIDEKLKITARTPIFEVKYFAKYSSRMGFKISVDAIHNLPSPNPHVVIYSLNPPASIYKGVKNDYDV